MKKIFLLLALITVLFSQTSEACHGTVINNVAAVDNGNGTTTYTINLTVDVGSLDGMSYGFGLVFGNTVGPTPVVLTSPAFTASLTRAGYNNLVGYTGAAIGTGLGAASYNYFDNRYGNRTDVLTYESNDGTWGFGSTDYTKTVVVTVQGCVETIALDGDFRSTGSATAAGSASCINTYSTGNTCTVSCSITALSAGTQTACVPATNTYTQQVTVTYSNAPASGTLNVNGQTFAIGTSPQTVTLTGLAANGASVNVTAVFSANGACTMTSSNLFTAPAACSAACTPNNGTWD